MKTNLLGEGLVRAEQTSVISVLAHSSQRKQWQSESAVAGGCGLKSARLLSGLNH